MEVISLSGNHHLQIYTQTRHTMDVSARCCTSAAPLMTRSPSPPPLLLLLIKGVCSRPPRIVVESLSSISPSVCGSQRLHFQAFYSKTISRSDRLSSAFFFFRLSQAERGRERAVMARYSVFSLDYISEEWPIHQSITFYQHKHPSSCIGRRLSEHRRVESVHGA